MADFTFGLSVADFKPIFACEYCAHYSGVDAVGDGASVVDIVGCESGELAFETAFDCDDVGFDSGIFEPLGPGLFE